MSVRTRLGRLTTAVVLGLTLVATSCSAAPTIVGTEDSAAASVDLDQATTDLDEAFDDLSEEEAELFLQAFEDAFNGEGSAIALDTDPYIESTVPANGGAPDHTTIPYGLCSDGWFVFDTLTWADAYAMLGHTGYNGGAAQDQYEYGGDGLDAGAGLINDELWCPIGGTDQNGNLSMTMHPYRTAPNRDYWTDETIAEQYEGDLRFTTTQAGQPLVVSIKEVDGQIQDVEVFLEWAWEGASDGAATLQLRYSNFYDAGVRADQVDAMVAIAELISANVAFSPPAFTSPLPTWYTCDGRNFINADVNEIAELIGFDGNPVAVHGIERDWQRAECILAEARSDGDIDWADGDFGVSARIYPAGSDDFASDIEWLLDDPETTTGTATIAGRSFQTFASPGQSGVILENGAGAVVVSVFSGSTQHGDDEILAKAIEIVEVITR